MDRIEQVEAAAHEWTVERTFRLLICGGHKAADAKIDLRRLAGLETLAENWRARAAALIG